MVEWRVKEALDDEAPPPPKPPRRRLGGRELLLVGGAIALVLLVSVGVLRWREMLAQRTIEEDILTAIRAEEQARRFGLEDKASQFIPADSPDGWRDRFTHTFTPTLSSAVPLSVSISLVSVSLQGQEAEVMVQVGQQLQERRYRLTEQGWQRIPIWIEGRGETSSLSADPNAFIYQAADASFAMGLYDDIPTLQAQIQAWGRNANHLIIEIRSDEFYPPAYYVNLSSTYRLSSPRVVTLPAHWDMTGEDAVRYRFAKTLWNTVRDSGISNRRLPGAGRFVLAAQTVLSLRWAVSDTTYQGFVAQWRSKQPPQIADALYSRPTHTGWMDIFAPSPEEAAALLLVNTIYDTSGADGLAAITSAMTTAEDWDTVLQPATGMTTRQLLAVSGGEPYPAPVLDTPAVVTGAPTLSEGWGSRYYELRSDTEGIVRVERTSASEVRVNNLEGLPEECAVLFSDVTVEGTWREEGLRLTAEQYDTDGDLLPLFPAPTTPPTNTQLYVSRLGNVGVFPSYGYLDAVQQDGTATSLWAGRPLAFEALNHNNAVMPQGITVAKYPGPACQEVVLYRWEPDNGIVGAWIAHVPNGFGGTSVWWDSERGQGLMTRTLYNAANTETWYWWLDPTQPVLPNEPDGRIPGGPVIALRPDSTQVVLTDAEQNQITLYDLTRHTAVWERDYRAAETFQGMALDAAGKFLYVGEIRYGVNAGSTITRYVLDTGQYTELAEFGNPFAPYELQVDALSSTVYAIIEQNAIFSLVAINNEGVHTVYTFASEERTYRFLSCRGGGALLVTYLQPRTQTDILAPQIRRIAPDGALQPDALPMNDYGFPLLCE